MQNQICIIETSPDNSWSGWEAEKLETEREKIGWKYVGTIWIVCVTLSCNNGQVIRSFNATETKFIIKWSTC